MMISGAHDPILVALSILTAVAASYTALDLAGRVQAARGWVRHAWLAAAALAMGGGIWVMHFVGMLAFSLPGMEMTYDVGLTILSLVVAVIATGIGFLVISRDRGQPLVLIAAGLFMGLGIVAMHYLGMFAMKVPADLRYDRAWVAVSVLIAIGAATVALWLSARARRQWVKMGAAVAMGLAIAGMHYAAMMGASFVMRPSMPLAPEHASLGSTSLALGVTTSMFLILFLALLAAMFDRRFAVLAERETAALRQSEERFRSLYTKTPLPLHSLDRDGRIEHVSDAWLDLLGYARADVVGRPFTCFMTESAAQRASEIDWPVLRRTGALKAAEYKIVTKSGDLRDVVSSAQVELDPDGKFLRVLGGVTDVTGHRQAEEALRQAQKMEAVGQLTGGVAHDFNNLLTIIQSSVDLLRKPGLSCDQQTRYLDAVADTVRRASKLTGQLLAFARRQALKPEIFEVGQRLREITQMLDSVTGSRIQVATDVPDVPCFVKADTSQFDTAIVNLAVNARDAMDGDGKLTLSLRVADPGSRRLESSASGPLAAVSVIDAGAGIPEEELGRIFEPFFTTKPVGKGTGLGLSQVFGFAKQSGGDIEVRSSLGAGSTFTLYLPLVAGAEQPLPDACLGHDGEPPAGGEHVLIVEDNFDVGRFATHVLDDLGYRTTWATSAEEALTKLDEAGTHYDLVFSDIVMPGMGGLQLARQLRSARPELPVVLASGYSDVVARDENHGFELLQKPYSAEQIERAFRKAAAARRTGRQGGSVPA